jgi:hypothetical protein
VRAFPFLGHGSHVLPSVFILKVCVVVPLTALGGAGLVAIYLPMAKLLNIVIAMLTVLHFVPHIIARNGVVVGKDCPVITTRIVC